MKDRKTFQRELELYLNNKTEGGVEIIEDATIEKEKFFVFFYQSKKYQETGNLSDRLAGNAPIIVNKESGERYVTGTARSIEYYIEEYEAKSQASSNPHDPPSISKA